MQLLRAMPLVAGMLLLVTMSVDSGEQKQPAKKGPPVFTLAWSEYPSWSLFAVASELGLIDGRKGQQGTLASRHILMASTTRFASPT